MVVDSHHAVPALRATMTTVVIPIQLMVDKPMQLVNWVGTSIASHQALIAENATLHAQQILLRGQLKKLLALESENAELRALLGSSPRLGYGRIEAAQIFAVDTEPNVAEVIIDKGSHDGVYVDQPVLDATGIVGQIIEVGPFTSRIMLVTDPRCAIPAQITRNGQRFLVSGTGALQPLALLHVPDTTDVRIGDVLVSSGLGQRYPIGYPVGVVTRVGHVRGEEFMTILIEPSAHLSRANLVLLFWAEKSVPANTISTTPNDPTKKNDIVKDKANSKTSNDNKKKVEAAHDVKTDSKTRKA